MSCKNEQSPLLHKRPGPVGWLGTRPPPSVTTHPSAAAGPSLSVGENTTLGSSATRCSRLRFPGSKWDSNSSPVLFQTLTKEGFDSISSGSKELLISALRELDGSSAASGRHLHSEHNMAVFLWSESPGDLPPDAAWVSVASRAPFQGSGLSMKTQAVSPCVQSFCSALDSKLKVKLEDLLAYLPSGDPSPRQDTSPAAPESCAFDRFADAETVQETLRTHSTACIQDIADCIQAELQSIEQAIQGQQDVLDGAKLHSALFMARLCQSLGELCPHLKQCILGRSGSPEQPARDSRALKKQGKGKAQEVLPTQARWQDVKELLLQRSVTGYRVWGSAVVRVSDTSARSFRACQAPFPTLSLSHSPGWPSSARPFNSKGITVLVSQLLYLCQRAQV